METRYLVLLQSLVRSIRTEMRYSKKPPLVIQWMLEEIVEQADQAGLSIDELEQKIKEDLSKQWK